MKIREKGLIIHNLLLTRPCQQEVVMKMANEMRMCIIEQGYYPTGPTIFTYKKGEGYRVGMTINTKVGTDAVGELYFQENLELPNCIYARVMEDEIDVTYKKIYEYAEKQNLNIVDGIFYNVILDVYGDIIVDIYLQVQ